MPLAPCRRLFFGRGPEQVGADLYAEGGQIMTDPAKPAAPAGI